MLTWMGMRHHGVKDATSEDLVVPPPVLADPTPWPWLRQRCRAPRGPAEQILLSCLGYI